MIRRFIIFIFSISPKMCIKMYISWFRGSISRTGYLIRRYGYARLCRSFGENVTIGPYVFLDDPQNIEIGNNVSIQSFCLLAGYGGIIIGNDVSVAPYCSFYSTSHPYKERGIKIREGKLETGKIVLKDNIWIGAGCIVLSNSQIEQGIVVGANSLVSKHLEKKDYLYGGSPAKPIKSRFE